MKKNFFKKLATVLSLALVVTTVVPAASTNASAASTPDLKARYSTAYEGSGRTYAVKNATGYTVKWAVTGKLATISKAGKLTVKTNGAKAGNVVVSAAFYKGGKKVVTRKDTVAIKVSAKSVAIKTAATVTAVPVGEVADLNRTLTPSNSTSKTYWTVAAKDGAATTDATIDAAGKFTATKAGDFVVTATVKNAKDSKVLATATQAITAVYAVKEAKQTTVTKVAVTFGADVSKVVTKDTLVITDANGVKQVVKAVSFSTDGKVVTAETYLQFADKATYTVTYGTSKTTFVASKGTPVKVVVTPKTVQYGKETAITVALLDANGVDVTTGDLLKDHVTFTVDNTLAYIAYNSTDSVYKITVFNYDKAVNVKATYHTWTYANNAEVTYDSEVAVVTSVKEIKDTTSDSIYTIATGSADWANVNSTIAASKQYKFYVKGTNQAGTKITQADFSYESTDTNVVTVYKNASNVVYVYGVAPGTAYIKATYGDTVKLFVVTVGKSSEATALAVDNGAVTVYANDATIVANNAVSLTFTVKDQYGKEVSYASATPNVSIASGTDSVNFGVGTANNVVTITGLKTAITTSNAGTSTYKVTYFDKTVYFTVTTVDVASTDQTQAYVGLDKTTANVDAAFDTTTAANKTVTFTAYKYNSKGQVLGTVSPDAVSVTYKDKAVATSATGTTDTKAYFTANTAGLITFYAADAVNGNQAAVGTYIVKVTSGSKNVSANIIVTNTQDVITVEQKNTSVTATSVGAVAVNGLTFTLDGKEVTPVLTGSATDVIITAVDYVVNSNNSVATAPATFVASGNVIYINTVTVTRNVAGATVTQVITVNKSFTVK